MTIAQEPDRFERQEWRQTGWCKIEGALRYIERIVSIKKVPGEDNAYEAKVRLGCSHTNDLVMSYRNANYYILNQKGTSL